MNETPALETVRSRALYAEKIGSHAFAKYLHSVADKGEEACAAEIAETRAIGKAIVDKVEGRQ